MNKLKYKISICIIGIVLFPLISFTQISIGTPAPNVAAELEIFSYSKGLLLPRLSTEEMINVKHEDALLIYNTSFNVFMLSLNGKWNVLNPWKGTQDKIYTESKRVGIGVEEPKAALDIKGNLRLVPTNRGNNNNGTIYFNESSQKLVVYNGTQWDSIPYDTDFDGIIDSRDPDLSNPYDYLLPDSAVLENKTYWANGQMRTGTMVEHPNEILPIILNRDGVFYRSFGYFKSFIIQGDNNLQPENIRKGVTLFGCLGEYCAPDSYVWIVETWSICHPIANNEYQTVPLTKHCEDCDGNKVSDVECSEISAPVPIPCIPIDTD